MIKDIIFYRDGKGKPVTNIEQHIVYHSPDGFEFGYGGSGPADLALNILYEFTENREFSFKHHQDFKRHFIAGAPKEGGAIKKEDILSWINDRTKDLI